MNLKQFARLGGKARQAKMTDEERAKHMKMMSDKSREKRAMNKSKIDLSTS